MGGGPQKQGPAVPQVRWGPRALPGGSGKEGHHLQGRGCAARHGSGGARGGGDRGGVGAAGGGHHTSGGGGGGGVGAGAGRGAGGEAPGAGAGNAWAVTHDCLAPAGGAGGPAVRAEHSECPSQQGLHLAQAQDRSEAEASLGLQKGHPPGHPWLLGQSRYEPPPDVGHNQ